MIPRNAFKEVKAFEHSILHDFEIIDLHEWESLVFVFIERNVYASSSSFFFK